MQSYRKSFTKYFKQFLKCHNYFLFIVNKLCEQVYICEHLNQNKMKAQIQIHLPSQHLHVAAQRFRLRNRKDLKYYENFDSLRDARQYLLDCSQDLEDTELGDDWLSYDSVTAYIVTEKEEMI